MPDKLQRRAAGRQGLVLTPRTGVRTRAVRFGLWFLHTARMNDNPGRLLTDRQGITVDTVEAFFNTPKGRTPNDRCDRVLARG